VFDFDFDFVIAFAEFESPFIHLTSAISLCLLLRSYARTCSATLDQARVGEPRIFKHAMLHVS
jgi:hypothetical protein